MLDPNLFSWTPKQNFFFFFIGKFSFKKLVNSSDTSPLAMLWIYASEISPVSNECNASNVTLLLNVLKSRMFF
jgi:hypothetical protein